MSWLAMFTQLILEGESNGILHKYLALCSTCSVCMNVGLSLNCINNSMTHPFYEKVISQKTMFYSD